MAKTYLERFGLDAVKKHLHRGTRYFRLTNGYANAGICLFDANKFACDLGVRPSDFPFHIREQSGWHLPAPPSAEELDKFLAARIA